MKLWKLAKTTNNYQNLQQKKAHEHNVSMFIAWDNEETGSRTPQGAASPFLKHLMKRICNALTGSEESFYCSLDKSSFINSLISYTLSYGFSSSLNDFKNYSPKLNSPDF